jgi:hypothetical protein
VEALGFQLLVVAQGVDREGGRFDVGGWVDR